MPTTRPRPGPASSGATSASSPSGPVSTSSWRSAGSAGLRPQRRGSRAGAAERYKSRGGVDEGHQALPAGFHSIGRQGTPAVADREYRGSARLDQQRDRAGAVHPRGIVRLGGQPPVFKRERYRVMNSASDGPLPMRTEVVVSAD